MKCGRKECKAQAQDGRYYCSRFCARHDEGTHREESGTSSTPRTEPSTSRVDGGPSPQSSTEEDEPQNSSERDTGQTSTEPSRPSTIRKIRTASASDIASTDDLGPQRRESVIANDESNGAENTESGSDGDGQSGDLETGLSRTEKSMTGAGSGTHHTDSFTLPTRINEELFRQTSLIKESGQVLLDCMKSASKSRDGQPITDFRQINAVANLGKQIASLTKVAVEVIKVAKQ